MKLDFIDYCENKGLLGEWRLEGGQLGKINLIVGKNASGKSKILKTIHFITGLLSGDTNLKRNRNSKEWTLIFDSNNQENQSVYSLSIENDKTVQENFKIGTEVLLDRTHSGEGEIFATELDKKIRFQVPPDEIAFLKKQDSIQHPFLEKLYIWAFSSRYYRFGTDLGKKSIIVTNTQKIDESQVDFKDDTDVIAVFKLGEDDFKTTFIQTIKSDMLRIGYEISDIGIMTPSGIDFDEISKDFKRGVPQYLCVQENDLKEKTEQGGMSQGMFRALSLIIQVNYSLMAKKPSCILIDDIGEGLDFDRSSAIIKLLIEKVKNSTVQLIMTTNDRFIMNGVPLEYWSVIERKPGVAKLHNIHNSQQIFEDFKFTGLNNFDFFSTQFYLEGFGEEEEIK